MNPKNSCPTSRALDQASVGNLGVGRQQRGDPKSEHAGKTNSETFAFFIVNHINALFFGCSGRTSNPMAVG